MEIFRNEKNYKRLHKKKRMDKWRTRWLDWNHRNDKVYKAKKNID